MPQKILIIRLSSLGDIVLTSPVVRAIGERYPDAKIHFCTLTEYAELARQIPFTETVIPVNRATVDETAKQLGNGGYDLVIDLHNNFRSKKLTSYLKVPVARVHKRTIRRWMMVRTKRNWMAGEPDVIGRYFEAAAKLLDVNDVGTAPQMDLSAISPTTSIAICPGSKHWNKQWPLEYYIEIAKSLAAQGYVIELYGSKEDAQLCNAIEKSVPGSKNFCGMLDLAYLPSHLAHTRLAVTNDSGLLHLSSAVGVPVVSFFGPTVKEFGFAPRAKDAIVLENEGLYCRPCTKIGLDHCPQKHFRCMKEITPDKAMISIETLLNGSY